MAKILIQGTEGWDTCDDCGSYDYERYVISVDGKEVLIHQGDTHLGGNYWTNWEESVTEILTSLGYEVEIDIERA